MLLERRASTVHPEGVIVKIREWKAGEEVTWPRMGKDVSWVAEEEEEVVLGAIALCLWTSLSEPAEA